MKKKYFAAGIIVAAFVLCAVILYAAIRLAPLLQTVRTLRQITGADSVSYEADITLNRKSFSKEQEQFLQAVAWVLETDEQSCMEWKVRGSVSDGRGYAQVFCDGVDGVVTDAYFGEDYAVMNVRMLYETLQKNFAGAHPILGSLLPDWKYSDYVSLEQVEEIFQVDIKGMYKLDLPKELAQQSTWKSVMMLQAAKCGKSEDGRQQFEMVWNDYQMTFVVGKSGQVPELSIQGKDARDSRIITSYHVEISSDGTEEIIYPDSVMEKDEVEQFRDLWNIIRELQGKVGKEQ